MERSLSIDGLRLQLFEYGAGSPCLMLHGYPQDHRCWRKVIPFLEGKRRILAPDWFGWGASERSLTASLRYEDEFPRVGKLLDLLGIQQVDLIGHDYGGLMALAYAAQNPQRVRTLALINTRAHGAIAFATRLLLNGMVALAQTPATRVLISLLPLKIIHQSMFAPFVANGCFSSSELDDYLSFLDSPHGRKWFAHFYRHFRTTPRRELGERARRFSFPVAIIWGDEDRYFPFAIGKDLAARLQQCTVTQLRGAGHFSPEERPREVAEALIALLDLADSGKLPRNKSDSTS